MRAALAMGLALMTLTATGCSTSDEPVTGSNCAGGTESALADVKWDEALEFDIHIRQDDYVPAVFGLIREQPYVLRFINDDDGNHGFRSPDFFKNVAVDTATVNGTAVEKGCLRSISIPEGAVAELRLVPLRDGRYEFKSSPFVDLGIGYGRGYGIGTVFVH